MNCTRTSAPMGDIIIDGRDVLDRGYALSTFAEGRDGVPEADPVRLIDRSNVAFALSYYEKLSRSEVDNRVEDALRQAALWDEVKDKLNESALSLSAAAAAAVHRRTIAVRPDILLLDEATSALDPISTAKVEELIAELRSRFTIVIVTHNIAAGRPACRNALRSSTSAS